MALPDSVLDHLRRVAELPDLAGTGLEFEEQLGRGGTGTVYAVRDAKLDRRVALKMLHADGGADGAASQQILREARLIAGLEHPGIPPIYDTGTLADGRPYYTMRLVEGAPLDPAAKASLSDRLALFQKVADAVAYAHAQGVLHRDLKPGNILVGSYGEVAVMDWATSEVRGTPGWSAPERGATVRSDVYSLGVLLGAMLDRASPAALQAIAAKASKANPAERYGSVSAMQAEIRRYMDGERVEAHDESFSERAMRLYRRHEVLWLLLAAYVGVRFFLFFWSRT